jgi:formylglycine-generating enzyme required for sulfatase activity/serine/threonine protein kinase
MSEIPTGDWSWVNQAAERFERAWKKGPRPRIEDYLIEVPEAQWPPLLQELMRVEGELRAQAGEEPNAEEYRRRFPEYDDVIASVFASVPPKFGKSTLPATEGAVTMATRDPVSSVPPELANHRDYEIIRELGHGGMGVVFLAHNRIMALDEVLKVIGPDIIDSPGVFDRFLREIRAVVRLQHPNIVRAHSGFRCGKSLVFAMEYVEGLDLARLVRAKGPVPVAHACYFVQQAALGLQHAHELGMVHRDIKPGNLMLSHKRGKAVIKVLDFGLAKAEREQKVLDAIATPPSREPGEAGGLTLPGEMLGTPDFIAPEQIADSQKADIRADIYSLGCTLYYLLSGRPPFPSKSMRDTLRAHGSTEALLLNLVRSEVPADLAAVVARMMAKQPDRRFQTPNEVAAALAPFFKKHSAPAASAGLGVDRDLAPEAAGEARDPAAGTGHGMWSSLIDFRETEDSQLDTPASAPALRPPWLRPTVAVGVLLLGLLVAWGVINRFRTPNGTIELENLPRDAEVFVDGVKAAVTWPGGGKPAMITAPPGEHKITVKKDGIEITDDEITVEAAGRAKFTLHMVPATEPTPEPPKDDALGSIENSIRMKLMLIPDGEFLMGSSDDALEAEDDEKPLHRVRITKPFYMGACEVTQAQYEEVMGNNPSHFSANGGGKDRVIGQSTDQCPVDNVSWFDAIKFCNKLSEKEGKKPFYAIDGLAVRVEDWNEQGYRLPTEAEWEYACRANASPRTSFSFGDKLSDLPTYAWFDANSEQRTHGVGLKQPNGFGLYDVHGNVSEWCWDWHLREYYSQSRTHDPTGPPVAGCRVSRGGYFRDIPRFCASFDRKEYNPEEPKEWCGFRVVLGTSFVNTIGMNLRLIPAAKFLMGSPDEAVEAENDERPQHPVRITKPFYMGTCEVTQAQYQAVMGNNPSHFSANGVGKDRVAGQSTDQFPVENVSWFDAIRFCNKLSEKEGKKPFYQIVGTDVRVPDWKVEGYRLPTEAEWEYACRANASTWTHFSFGDRVTEMPGYAWFEANSDGQTHAVGQKRPNRFGLCDMHGNVYEWCWDWFLGEYYSQYSADDPTGAPVADQRVARGGNFMDPARFCRSANRGMGPPDMRREWIGFRVALGASESRRPNTEPAGGNGSSQGNENSSRGGGPAPPQSTNSDLLSNSESFVNTIGMKLRLIPAAEFLMGSPDDGFDAVGIEVEKPRHHVQITRPFFLGVYEVTQAEYKAVMGNNPSRFSAIGEAKERVAGQSTDKFPVETVSWLDAIQFCNKLSDKEHKTRFYEIEGGNVRVPDWHRQGYRLPTEAEWEYACRTNARMPTRFSFGDNDSDLQSYAWFGGNSEDRSHPVGQKRPNDFGLYDMHGNVWEWCWDWLDRSYYEHSPSTDPRGPSKGVFKVFRGGAMGEPPYNCRSARRYEGAPDGLGGNLGFRVALGAPERPGPKTESGGSAGPSPASEKSGGVHGPATSAAGAVRTPARAPSKKPSAIRRQRGAARESEPAHPFRIATNGLGGKQLIDPVAFDVNWVGVNQPVASARWSDKVDFAQIRTSGVLHYPRLPVSRYVFEVELTVSKRCGMEFQLGDQWNASHIFLYENPKTQTVECTLRDWFHGGWAYGPKLDFTPGMRLALTLVVGDGWQTLFHDGKLVVGANAWPTDCGLRICCRNPDSAVIHRCSLRPLTAQDAAACEFPFPPTRVPFVAGEAAARMKEIARGYPARPTPAKPFIVKTTSTPMVWIKPGEFEMGPRGSKDEGQHRVRITKGYWMAQIEVTQAEFSKVTGANPSRVRGSPYLPVDWVAWDAAMAYCRKLTDLEREAGRLPLGFEFRLPTEAEWEYACRAGADSDFSVAQALVWMGETSGRRPHEVAESQPNEWGLYDMHGNAMEWCLDAWYNYPNDNKAVSVDPFTIGAPDKDTFVVRGGAWWFPAEWCTSQWRSRNHNSANAFRGFRIVLGPEIRELESTKK